MNPFQQQGAPRQPGQQPPPQQYQQQQQQGQPHQQRASLPPLVMPGRGQPPPQMQGPRGMSSPPAQGYASPPQSYDDRAGGSFSHYAPRGPGGLASPPMSPPGPQRPGLGHASVSFQEQNRPSRQQPQRSGPSRESIKKADMGPRRSSAATGVSDMPELSRSISGGIGNASGSHSLDPEIGFSGANANFRRKKSLVRPDRERMDPSHRQWYYRNHAAQMDAVDAQGRAPGFSYMPSTTGHLPQHGAALPGSGMANMQGPGGGLSGLGMAPMPQSALGGPPHHGGKGMPPNMPPGGLGRPAPATGLRRGKSILGREEDQVETGINLLKRGVSLRRSRSQQRKDGVPPPTAFPDGSRRSHIAPGPVGPWMIYCYVLTICCPGPFLSVFGIKTPEQQRAWREKIGIISIIVACMSFVGLLTFGFTQAVCNTKATRYKAGDIDSGSSVAHGYDYDFNNFFHPQVSPFDRSGPFNHSNPAYSEPWSTGGRDVSMLFQQVGGQCTEYLTNTAGGGQPTSYFPCAVYNQDSTVAATNDTWCHSQTVSTRFLRADNSMRKGQVSYSWDQVASPTANLVVWKGAVLDLSRLSRINNGINKPALFNQLRTRNETFAGRDVTAQIMRTEQDGVFDCIEQLTRVGFVDSKSIGCVAADVELYVSLVFIIGVVSIKFLMAVIFGWFLSWRLGNYSNETYEERMKRAAEIEKWTSDIYRPAPAAYRPNVKKHRSFLPKTSRFSTGNALNLGGPPPKPGARTIMSEKGAFGTSSAPGSGNGSVTGSRSPALRSGRIGGIGSPMSGSPPGSPSLHGARSSASLVQGGGGIFQGSYGHSGSRRSSFSNPDSSPGLGASSTMGACPFPLLNVVPQPPADYQPFNFPLAHSICLVTAYSESFEGLRTTLDSLATTDYPNSHKLLLVVADGIVRGAGSDISTPDIVLSMMKDFVVAPEEVEGNSYVAIADGYKRHNMAKVYAGFYEYDDETVERSKQQRVPMVLVAKCGSPLEADSAKPGNRGKRDSQVMLMAFMQKVMFDERMTTFDYEFFNSIWRVTGVSPDHYEIVLMVDADTKVFPDSLSRMVACMVEDPEIMGLCGETKIANKTETWVTMIQVFEYYISHHSTKAFEACFGGVTCLPGCFSAYRIKAPKGPNGYWVPILANPDIVEHYSENVVDTLHKKNLLLLGEDRYLTTLMLKTFPKRKMMFVPQAVCKTIVPDTFRVLLSQRRRWINSTVHNLAELVLVNDLCGTFCFSMRFVVFMELAGTLVLPAAIAFTFYVVAQAIIASVDPSKGPVPVIPLILLGVILGLPGLLIVVTSRKLVYVGWMGIYLCSLPIWNFVFPSYAFWHMDDFSWGATRIVQGDKGGDHSTAEGKFDASHITMKRWGEFERERRWKSGTHSRDSTFDVIHRSGSPERSGSTRYSVVSSDTYHSNANTQDAASNRLLSNTPGPYESDAGHSKTGSSSGGARARLDAVPLLELPAPLGPDAANKARGLPASGTPGSITVARPREPSPAASSQAHSHSSNASRPPYDAYPSVSTYHDDEARPMMASATSSPDPEASAARRPNMQPMMMGGGAALAADLQQQIRHGSVSSEQQYPGVSEAQFSPGFTAEPEEDMPMARGPPVANAGQRPRESPQGRLSRGFSLVDDGPVASSQGVRQVTRGARRQSTAKDQHGPTSPSSVSGSSAAHGAAQGGRFPRPQ